MHYFVPREFYLTPVLISLFLLNFFNLYLIFSIINPIFFICVIIIITIILLNLMIILTPNLIKLAIHLQKNSKHWVFNFNFSIFKKEIFSLITPFLILIFLLKCFNPNNLKCLIINK